MMDCNLPGLCPQNFPGKNTRVGCHALLLGASGLVDGEKQIEVWETERKILKKEKSQLSWVSNV